jgi:hypothetical protein
MFSPDYSPNYIQVPKATVLCHYPRFAYGFYILYQRPDINPTQRTPCRRSEASLKRQGVSRCQAAARV